MIQGLYAAANGMMAVEDRQAVIANNIANATTAGFKRQIPVQRGFHQVFVGAMRDTRLFNHLVAPGGGLKLVETFSNHGNGMVSDTGNSLDIALTGPGLLAVETPQGERYTRQGRLSIGPAGDLITLDGHRVLGVGDAPINVAGGNVSFGEDGAVLVNGVATGQLKLVEFEDLHMLEREGMGLFYASEDALARSGPVQNTTVRGGALEASNVQVPLEMTSMLTALRNYAANQQVIDSVNQTLGRLIDQVGAPA